MHWQDWVLTIGSFIFSIALIPSLVSKDKPALSTSFMTGIILAVYTVVYATLSLWLSAFSTSLVCIIWLTLGVQKYLQVKSVKNSDKATGTTSKTIEAKSA